MLWKNEDGRGSENMFHQRVLGHGPDTEKPFKFMVSSIVSAELRLNLDKPPNSRDGTCLRLATEHDISDDKFYQRYQKIFSEPSNQHTNVRCNQHVIYVFGRTSQQDGARSVGLVVPYPLGLAIEMPACYSSEGDVQILMQHLAKLTIRHNNNNTTHWIDCGEIGKLVYTIEQKARSVGWVPSSDDKTKPRLSTIVNVQMKNKTIYNKIKNYLSSSFQIRMNSGVEKTFKVSLHETIDYYSPQMRFSIDTGIDPGNWVEVSNFKSLQSLGWPLMQTDLQGIIYDHQDLQTDQEDQRIEPMTECYIDLECINGTRADREHHKKVGLDVFPDPANPDHKIIMAGVTFRMADGRVIRYLLQLDHEESAERKLTLAASGNVENRIYSDKRFDRVNKKEFNVDMKYACHYFADEKDLILAVRDLFVWYDPDIIVSFNGDKFDYPYLMARADVTGASKHARMTQWSRLSFDHWRMIQRNRETVDIFDYALDFKSKPELTPQLSGRISLDLRVLMMSLKGNPKYRFSSTTLDNVSERFLGDKKIDMGHNKIFDSWFGNLEGQAPEDQRMWLGHYCVKDVELPMRIIENQYFRMYLVQMGRITHTPPHNIINNGQMMRVCAQFCHKAREQNRFVNKVFIRSYPYQGACVLEPSIGFYGGSAETSKTASEKITRWVHGNNSIDLSEAEINFPRAAIDDSTQIPNDMIIDPDDATFLNNVETLESEIESSAAKEPMPEFMRDLPDMVREKLIEASRESIETLGGLILDPKDVPDVKYMWYNKRKTPQWIIDYLETMPILDRIEYESDDIVLTLDFQSLYPSIMRTHRLCPSNYLIPNRKLEGAEAFDDEVKMREIRLNRYKSGNNADYNHGGVGDGHGSSDDDNDSVLSDSDNDEETSYRKSKNAVETTLKESDRSGVVVDHKDRDDYTTIRVDDPSTNISRFHQFTVHSEGIYPELLKCLLDERVVFKGKIKTESKKASPDEMIVAILDGRQLALKVSANSIYGVSGAKNRQDTSGSGNSYYTPCACCPLAESVTAVGRQMISKTKHTSENQFKHLGTRVIYGDSVTGDTPIIVLIDNQNLTVCCIDELDRLVAPDVAYQLWHGDKWGLTPARDVKVLSDGPEGQAVFVPLIRVIKHKTRKAIHRVITHHGMVDVTSDHSLLDHKGDKIAASDVVLGTRLLHIPLKGLSANFPPPKFDGTYASSKKDITAEFISLYHRSNPGQHPLVNIGDDNDDKWMIGVQAPLWDGLNDQITSIFEIKPEGEEIWVYDLETANHHFHVGPGNLVVHNTDSVMVHMLEPDDVKAWKGGSDIANHITEHVFCDEHDVNVLHFEKGARGYSLYSKKCYISQAKEKADGVWKEDKKGICTVRRDKPKVLTDLVTQLSEIAGHCYKLRRDVIAQLMVMTCIDHFENMLNGTHGLDKYVICQSINKTTKDSAHVVMARKLEQRTGATVSKGDAVYYVHTKGNEKASYRVETPLVLKDCWRTEIDRLYYLTNKIMDQVTKHLKIFLPGEVIDKLFNEYKAAMSLTRDVRSFLSTENPIITRRNAIMRVLFGAIARGRLPERDNIPAPLNPKKRKRETKEETKRKAVKSMNCLDDMLGLTKLPTNRKQLDLAEPSKPKKKRLT